VIAEVQKAECVCVCVHEILLCQLMAKIDLF
jgi:hypothetical protein